MLSTFPVFHPIFTWVKFLCRLHIARMKRQSWIALLLLGLVLASACVRAEEEDYDEEEGEDAAASGGDEGDVVVLTKDNFEEKVKQSKFALVSGPPPCPLVPAP